MFSLHLWGLTSEAGRELLVRRQILLLQFGGFVLFCNARVFNNRTTLWRAAVGWDWGQRCMLLFMLAVCEMMASVVIIRLFISGLMTTLQRSVRFIS